MSSFKGNSSISVKLFPFGRSLNTCIGLLPYFPLIHRLSYVRSLYNRPKALFMHESYEYPMIMW